MANNIVPSVVVSYTAQITFTEAELRVLDAMAGYGADEFLKAFYKHLGKSYMAPHEAGIRTLFASIHRTIPFQLSTIDAARKLLSSKSLAP